MIGHRRFLTAGDGNSHHARFRSGLTLLELVVVLVILAIVATVAVQSLQPQVDQQRFASASRLLTEIKTATLGATQKYQTDGTPLISGFVADVGRSPLVASANLGGGETQVLSELWDPQTELGSKFPFQFRSGPNQPTDYSTIRLPCGWRGPYMQLGIGMNSIRDPWGRPPELLAGTAGELAGITITIPPTSDDVEPQVIAVELTSGKVDVIGKVLLDNPENTTAQVVLLTPDPNSSLTTLGVRDDEDEQPDSFIFRNVPIGLRAIVADVNGLRKIKYIQVTHGGAVVVFDFQTRESNSEN